MYNNRNVTSLHTFSLGNNNELMLLTIISQWGSGKAPLLADQVLLRDAILS